MTCQVSDDHSEAGNAGKMRNGRSCCWESTEGPGMKPQWWAGSLSRIYSQPIASWRPQDTHSFLNLKGTKSWWNHLEVSPYLVKIAPYLEGFFFLLYSRHQPEVELLIHRSIFFNPKVIMRYDFYLPYKTCIHFFMKETSNFKIVMVKG